MQETVSQIRLLKSHMHTPVLLFSSKIEYLVSAFIKWKNCEFFLLPFDEEKSVALQDLLHFYVGLYQKIHSGSNKFCQIQTSKGVYNLPFQEILFVESTMKKSTVHLKNESIPLPYPLYRVKEWLTDEAFVQTHRSFIVNTNNISYIDKTKEPWGIFFFGSEKEAFVSRSHKKLLPSVFHCSGTEYDPPVIDFSRYRR